MADKGTIFPKENSPSNEDKLDLLVEKSRKVVFEVKTFFPFDLFPDEITICLNRVTITYRGFFGKSEYPIPLENINGARIYRSIFLASLSLETFGYEKPPVVDRLRINEARLARRYILGLVECKKNGVDLSTYPIEKIRDKLKEIGKVREGYES